MKKRKEVIISKEGCRKRREGRGVIEKKKINERKEDRKKE
jgi:hypothetical protein